MIIAPTGEYLDIELQKEIKNIELSQKHTVVHLVKDNVLNLVSIFLYRRSIKSCVIRPLFVNTTDKAEYVGQELKQLGRVIGQFETFKIGCDDLEPLLIYLAEQRYFYIIIDTIGWYPDTMLSTSDSDGYTKKLIDILKVYSKYFEHIIISNPYNNLYASLYKYFKKGLLDSVDKN